jgi:hypothetical protein
MQFVTNLLLLYLIIVSTITVVTLSVWLPKLAKIINVKNIRLICLGEEDMMCFLWGNKQIFKYYLDKQTLQSYIQYKLNVSSTVSTVYNI